MSEIVKVTRTLDVDVDEGRFLAWAIKEGLKKLNKIIAEGMEPCGEREMKAVLDGLLDRLKRLNIEMRMEHWKIDFKQEAPDERST